MKKILSIIIPAYNVEKYIEQCLASLEVPEILDLIEVIIVNDGSKDRTPEIAMKYCRKYPETYFLFNKENGGHGSAINYGIKYATGKYFKVVDGDDWLNSDKLPEFVQTLEQAEEDIVAADFQCIQDGTGCVLQEKYCTPEKEQYGRTFRLDQGEVKNVIKMHALTIKTEILKSNHITIDEKCYYVDCEYITFPIPYVKSVFFYSGFIYMYRLGRNGQSMDIRSMQKNHAQHRKVLDSLLSFYDNNCGKMSEKSQNYVETCIAQVVENEFQIYISMGLKHGTMPELRKWDRQLKADYPKIYDTTSKKSITLLRKTNYLILPLGTLVYWICK